MNHASLFSGIGGFDLAAKWMGWENVMQSEIDPFCRKVLCKLYPSATLYGDIRKIDGTAWKGKIDILTGGVPCQPASQAGRRRGKGDDRWLWPEAFRILREVQPAWAVFENVRGLASLDNGLVFPSLLSEMETHGYEVQPFCIPACAVGAPHRRDRLWIIAHAKDMRCDVVKNHREDDRCKTVSEPRNSSGPIGDTPDSRNRIWKGQGIQENEKGNGKPGTHANDPVSLRTPADNLSERGQGVFPQTVCGKQGFSWIKDVRRIEDYFGRTNIPEPLICRTDDGIRSRLHALGNSIVPQIAYQIFQAIEYAQN